jgi:hypothetical protein
VTFGVFVLPVVSVGFYGLVFCFFRRGELSRRLTAEIPEKAQMQLSQAQLRLVTPNSISVLTTRTAADQGND